MKCKKCGSEIFNDPFVSKDGRVLCRPCSIPFLRKELKDALDLVEVLRTVLNRIAQYADPDEPEELSIARRMLAEVKCMAEKGSEGKSRWIEYYEDADEYYAQMADELNAVKEKLEVTKQTYAEWRNAAEELMNERDAAVLELTSYKEKYGELEDGS